MNIGGFINSLLDKFLPDIVGDLIGAAVDVCTGNTAGAACNALDALEDVFEAVGADEVAQAMDVIVSVVEIVVSPGSAAGSAISTAADTAMMAADTAIDVASTAVDVLDMANQVVTIVGDVAEVLVDLGVDELSAIEKGADVTRNVLDGATKVAEMAA